MWNWQKVQIPFFKNCEAQLIINSRKNHSPKQSTTEPDDTMVHSDCGIIMKQMETAQYEYQEQFEG